MEQIELSKDQRFVAYVILLDEAELKIQKHDYSGRFCYLIKQIFGFNGDEEYWWEENTKYFPEIENKNPHKYRDFGGWFGYTAEGWQKRIEILKQCIKSTSN